MPMNLKGEIVAGESYSLEFKRVPNEDREKYLKTVVAVDEAAFATQMNVYRGTVPDREGNEGNREGNEGNNEGNDPNGTDDGTNGTNRGRNLKRVSGAIAPVTAPVTAPVNEPVNEPVTPAKKLLRIIRENPGRRKQELVAFSGLRPWTVKRLVLNTVVLAVMVVTL